MQNHQKDQTSLRICITAVYVLMCAHRSTKCVRTFCARARKCVHAVTCHAHQNDRLVCPIICCFLHNGVLSKYWVTSSKNVKRHSILFFFRCPWMTSRLKFKFYFRFFCSYLKPSRNICNHFGWLLHIRIVQIESVKGTAFDSFFKTARSSGCFKRRIIRCSFQRLNLDDPNVRESSKMVPENPTRLRVTAEKTEIEFKF